MYETIYHAPDIFSKAYFNWHDQKRQISFGNEVRDALKKLSYNELIKMLGTIQPPNRVDIHWFTVLELTTRDLTDQQIEQIREVWQLVPIMTKKNITSTPMTCRERLDIKKLLVTGYQC